MKSRIRVAVVGGDQRERAEYPAGVEVRRYGSSRYRGNGALRRLLSAVESGGVDVVILLVRWLGHAASEAVRDACRRQSVPVHVVTGGESSARRAVFTIAEEE